jgi:microcystin-dependent protein
MASDPFVGEISVFAFNFAPKGWARCDGQILPISQNTALFSLLGTQYGGNGQSTFALPNLQGSCAVNQGQGPGLPQRFVGEVYGSETVTLLESEMPAHSHAVSATTANANSNTASGGQPAKAFKGTLASSNTAKMYTDVAPAAQMSGQAVAAAGSSVPHTNLMPYNTFNFCIAMQGVYPPRS